MKEKTKEQISIDHQVTPENIFILDDNPDDLKLISTLLKREFPKALLLISETKKQLMEKLSWVKPDIIICDFRLRSCNGLDVLIEIREKSDVPFIFCTSALDNHNELSDSILNGASGYVLKDDINDLPKMVGQVVNKHAEKVNERMDREKHISLISYKLQRLQNTILVAGMDNSIADQIKQIISDLDQLK